MYYCDRENWRRIINGKYPINDDMDSLCVEEGRAEYKLEENEQRKQTKSKKKTGDKKHDKIFKEILQNKEEISKFISKFTKYNVKTEELKIYTPNYITEKFEYKNADIVYKLKGKELYFLIEHQTKVDYSMAYRILRDCLEIIRSVVEDKEINRLTFKYPRVVPIVLYTGNQKWSSSNSFAKIQEGETKCDVDKIDVKYQLVDINKYDVEELLKERTMLANVMILEKCKDNEAVISNLTKIMRNNFSAKNYDELKRIVMYLYDDVSDDTKKEIIKIIEESESEEDMSTIRERIGEEFRNERKTGIAEGILQTITQIVEKMINMNLDDDFIKQVTGAKKTEIERIRKEMK